MSQKISANEIRTGNVLEFKGKLWSVLKHQHIKPGKGGAFIQVEMKALKEHTKLNHRFRSEEAIVKAYVEEEKLQYLFCDSQDVHVLNKQDYSQAAINKDLVGDAIYLLSDDIELTIQKYNDEIIGISLPEKVKVQVKETEPYIKGQTATASYKSATLTTGLRIMVPPFIKSGDFVIISSEDHSYCERVEEK